LRIDVDHGGDTGLSHRRRGVGEHRRRPRGDAARLLGLGDELRAMAAAKAQQRGRAEQVVAQPGLQLGEQARGDVCLGPRGDDADEVAKRWVPELASPLDLLGQRMARASGWKV
jgi:hypothetical protein